MTKFAFSPSLALAAPVRFAGQVANGLAVRVAKAWVAYRNRRAVTELMGWDDVMLKDIGLTRGDIYRALSSPITEDPSARLVVYGVQSPAVAPAAALDRHQRVTRLVHSMLTRIGPQPDEDTTPCRP